MCFCFFFIQALQGLAEVGYGIGHLLENQKSQHIAHFYVYCIRRERWSETRMQGCEESLDNSWQHEQCKIGSSGYRWKKSLYDNGEISEASKIQVFFHHE